ncbi:MAG: formate dehydrogenase subunit delta [Paucibacter sp.]|nr:formate dehydrogenase subunit delta [Roseateles sp.]
MHVENLIKMANQIGDFFAAFPDREEALDGVATHIKKFWEPRMRRELLAHVDSVGYGELNATTAEAIKRHRAQLQ